jgi:hypothetical protein
MIQNLDVNNFLKKIQAQKKHFVSLNLFDNIQVHHLWNKIPLNKNCDKVMKIDKYD